MSCATTTAAVTTGIITSSKRMKATTTTIAIVNETSKSIKWKEKKMAELPRFKLNPETDM